MTDREKVIKGLECCTGYCDEETGCPYYGDEEPFDCEERLRRDAIALLKAQEPRVMTPADVRNIGPEDICAFIEIREETHMYACYMRQYDETHTEIMCDVPDLPTKIQNGYARLWTSRPTDARREAVKWDD